MSMIDRAGSLTIEAMLIEPEESASSGGEQDAEPISRSLQIFPIFFAQVDFVATLSYG